MQTNILVVEDEEKLARFDCLHDVKSGAGTSIENTTEGGSTHTQIVGEHLLGHVLRVHNLPDTIFHFLSLSG